MGGRWRPKWRSGEFIFFWYRLGHPKGRPGAVLETLGGPLQPSGDPLGVPDHAKTASEVQWTLEEAFSDLSTNLKMIGFTIVKRIFFISRCHDSKRSPGACTEPPRVAQNGSKMRPKRPEKNLSRPKSTTEGAKRREGGAQKAPRNARGSALVNMRVRP